MIFTKLIAASSIARASAEDLCSQLNHIWSVLLLLTMGVLITMVQYVGDPIHCWCPAHMPEVHCNYTKALCWVKANYYYDSEEVIPQVEAERWETRIAYYPWVPWILFAMATILKLPHVMWQSFMPSSGLNLSKLVLLADSGDVSYEDLAKIIRIWLVRYGRAKKSIFDSAKRVMGSCGLFWLGRHHMTYLTGLIIWVKLSYLLATIGLFFSLNLFLGVNFVTYGYDVIANFIRGIPLTMDVFPKNTICDMRIRQMTNIHTYSIQCILPINLYNQYIFIFLWYYFIILTIANFYSLGKWSLILLSEANRVSYIKGHSRTAHRLTSPSLPSYVTPTTPTSPGNGVSLPPIGESSTDPLPMNGAAYDSNNNNDSSSNNNNTRPRARRLTSRMDSTVSTGSTIRRMDSVTPDEDLPPERRDKRQIRRMTSRMMRHCGHDGVVVFRTLEAGVGVIVANSIFQALYEQLAGMKNALHYL